MKKLFLIFSCMQFWKSPRYEQEHEWTWSTGGSWVNEVQDLVNSTVAERLKPLNWVVELDSENYGAPLENSGITVWDHCNMPAKSSDDPVAIRDVNGFYHYNPAAAIRLQSILWRRLPSCKEFVAAFKNSRDKFDQYHGFFYKWGHQGSSIASYWNSSLKPRGLSNYVTISRDDPHSINTGAALSANCFMPIRFVLDKK